MERTESWTRKGPSEKDVQLVRLTEKDDIHVDTYLTTFERVTKLTVKMGFQVGSIPWKGTAGICVLIRRRGRIVRQHELDSRDLGLCGRDQGKHTASRRASYTTWPRSG